MPNFRVETGIEQYRICSDENEGPLSDYGDAATLVVGQAVYYCLIQDPDNEQPPVYRIDQVSEMETEHEDVKFDGEEDEDEEDDGTTLVETEEEEEEVAE